MEDDVMWRLEMKFTSTKGAGHTTMIIESPDVDELLEDAEEFLKFLGME